MADENLRTLEILLNEFYNSSTENSRKGEIEKILSDFNQQTNAWKYCLEFVKKTSNQYVAMICLSTIERQISVFWRDFDVGDREFLKSSLHELIMTCPTADVAFIYNKIVKILVDIACHDWPHDWPDFLDNVLSGCVQGETRALALKLLQTCLEEMGQPRADLRNVQTQELRRRLIFNSEKVLQVLQLVLEQLGKFSSQVPSKESCHLLLCLYCFAQLVSSLPLGSTEVIYPLQSIFQIFVLGFKPGCSKGRQIIVNQAATCINEVVSKNCLPPDLVEPIAAMYDELFNNLQNLKECDVAAMDEKFRHLLIELFNSFANFHFSRCEGSAPYLVHKYIAQLHHFMIIQRDIDDYLSCLSIWVTVVDHLILQTNSAISNSLISHSYKSDLLKLSCSVFNKFQFRFNQTQMEELDNELLDDDEETEWQKFLLPSLELLAQLAQLFPEDILQLMMQPFMQLCEGHFTLEGSWSSVDGSCCLAIRSELECRRLHCNLRDMVSLELGLARLQNLLLDSNFVPMLQTSSSLINCIVKICQFSCRLQLYQVKSIAENVLVADFIDLHAQSMAFLVSCSSWFCQLYQHDEDSCLILLSNLLQCLPDLLLPEIPLRLTQNAVNLVHSIMINIRVSALLEFPAIQALYAGTSNADYLPSSLWQILVRALSHFLILPWLGRGDDCQEWEMRAEKHYRLIASLTSSYQTSPLDNQVMKKTLPMLSDLVEKISDSGVTRSKAICYSSIQEVLSLTINNFSSSDLERLNLVLQFLRAVVSKLHLQMGPDLTRKIIDTLMSQFSRHSVSQFIQSSTSSGFCILESFVKILEKTVQEPGSIFKKLLPDILNLTLNSICPLIVQRAEPDLKLTLFEFLFNILEYNWRFFFPSSVIAKVNGELMQESVNYKREFVQIMECFATSFLQNDLHVFKQNLHFLQSLNSKWNLYKKVLFQEKMRDALLTVFLHSMLTKSHTILHEDIILVVFNIASSDFNYFFKSFLPKFVANNHLLNGEQKAALGQNVSLETDLPSFCNSMHQFVVDMSFHICCQNRKAPSAFLL